jgi:uncharacterized protein YdhG (YjbR/CyaY superfamily)
VSASEVDQYLAALDEPKRATLAQLRQAILDVLPEAARCASTSTVRCPYPWWRS